MTPRHEGKQELLDELTETWSSMIEASATASASSLKSMSAMLIFIFMLKT